MRTIFYVLLAFVSISCKQTNSVEEKLIRDFEADPKIFIRQGWKDGRYDQLLGFIESGDERFIKLTPRIRPYVDAASSEGLSIVLARALLHKPELVLGMVPEQIDIQELCTIPYIEETIEVERSHLHAALKALQRVKNPELEKRKSECLIEFERIKKNIESLQ